MADGYDRFDNDNVGGGSFVMGLLTGTVLGAGLGMLFAPKSGSEIRNQISEQAGNIANTAAEGYRRATETAADLANRGRDATRDVRDGAREVYDKARDAVARGAEEAQRYVRDATGNTLSGSQMASGSGGMRGGDDGRSAYGSAPESSRGPSVGSYGTGGSRG
jgi:gas vesicle protein